MNLEVLNENEVQREEILQGSAEQSRITHESQGEESFERHSLKSSFSQSISVYEEASLKP